MNGRRTRFWLLATVALFVGGPALSQDTLRVRVGEHPGYSRIVIDGRAGMAMAWGVDGRSVQVLMPAAGYTTPATGGVSRVGTFEVVPNDAGSVLRIALTCDCGARVQRLGDGRVVVDIAEGAPRPTLPEVIAAARPAAPSANEPARPGATPTVVPADVPRPAAPAPLPPAATASQVAQTGPRGAPVPPMRPERAAPVTPAAAAIPTPEQPASEPAPAVSAPPPLPSHDDVPSPTPAEAPARGETPDDRVAEAEPQVPPEAIESVEDDPMAATVAAARAALLRQLTRAAAEGLVTLADPAAVVEAPDKDAAEVGGDPAATPPADDSLPLLARPLSEIERARHGAARTPTATVPEHCLADDLFAVGSWTTDAPLALQMGQHRRAMVGEFDAASPRAVLAYVRLLLANGFGLEAAAALRAFAVELPPTPHLADLARLVDGEPVPATSAVGRGLGCPGAHGTWAVAAAAMDGRLAPADIDLQALRRILPDLPPRLRTRLIVPIATVALEADMLVEAEALTGIAARAEPPLPDGDGMLVVLMARIEAARGEWRRAEAALAPLLNQTSPAGIEAMIRMVEFRVARRLAAPPGMAENMEAIAFTLGSSELGRRLLRAAASARASGEGLGLALGALRTLAERGGDAGSAEAAARDMLVDFEPDPAEGAAYAEAVLAHEMLLGDGPDSDRARISIARNFMAIGVENLAERMLAPALARGVPAARLVAAQAATSGWEAPLALDLLDGLEGPEAARARAEALFALGDYAGAAAAARESGDREATARFDWLAGNWAAAAAAGTADRRILAAWMAGTGAMPPELLEAAANDPNLAARADAFAPPDEAEPSSLLDAAGTALEQSRRRRAIMGEILRDG